MSFTLNQWRNDVRQCIADFARDPQGALARTGVHSVYGFLLGSSLFPVVAAAATDPGSAIVVLSSVVGGVGANLVANMIQQTYDTATVITVAAQEAQQDDLAPAYAAIAQELELLPLAEQMLAQAGQTSVLEQLRTERQHLGNTGPFAGASLHVEQSGGIIFGSGTQIGQMGDVRAGDTVGGDKVLGNKTVTYGPQISGPISSGRDMTIGTHLTITSSDSAASLGTPPAAPSVSDGPMLRLWLETSDGQPLNVLTIHHEAVLRAGVSSDDQVLPTLDLVLEADGVGVVWPDDTRRRLVLRASTSVRPARWTVVPTQTGTLTLRVLALVNGTVIQHHALSAPCVSSPQSSMVSGTGAER